MLGALASGASPVIAVDLYDDKLALARSLGPSDRGDYAAVVAWFLGQRKARAIGAASGP